MGYILDLLWLFSQRQKWKRQTSCETIWIHLQVRVRIASWSNIGGWKENAHVLNFPRACFSLEYFGGKFWSNFLKSSSGGELWPCPHQPVGYVHSLFKKREHYIGFVTYKDRKERRSWKLCIQFPGVKKKFKNQKALCETKYITIFKKIKPRT